MPQKPAKQLVRESFDRAAATYDGAACLQRDVCERLLAGFTAQPSNIIDAGCGTGYGSRLLHQRWPGLHITAADFAPAMVDLARHEANANVVADIEALPFANSSFDAWWSNLSIQWCAASRVFAEASRVLRKSGSLAVATLGPRTFTELREAFSGIDPYRHTLPFSEPDEIRQTLTAAGFQNIAVQRHSLTVHYPNLKTLLRAVKAIGANRIGADARRGMMGRSAWQKLESAYECQRDSEGMPATYDAILCYAEKP